MAHVVANPEIAVLDSFWCNMQRKRYRDYSTSVELGNALNFVRDSHMRKFTTSRFVKCAILVIVGYIVVSVYLKHRSVSAYPFSIQQR